MAKAPWHVCLVTDTYVPEINGVAHTLVKLIRGLKEKGHRVSVVRPRQPQPPIGIVVPPDRDIQVAGVPIPFYRELRFGLPADPTLVKLWNEDPPDAVYIATEGPLGWSALQCGLRLGLCVVTGFHTNYHTYLDHYRLRWARPAGYLYLRHFHNAGVCTVVPSLDLAARLRADGFRNLMLMGRGIDTALFNPARRCPEVRRLAGVEPEDPLVVYVGRVAAEKNITLAFDAFRAMHAGNPRARFLVVGDGPMAPQLKAAHPDVVFAGVKRGEDLARHYASGDIFLFPSETETFGNVTLEAMASGLALVAFDYAAARMHVRDGETGLLSTLTEHQSFIDAARVLATNPGLVLKLRSAARRSIETHSWAVIVDRFESILTDAMVLKADADADASLEQSFFSLMANRPTMG